MEQSTPGSVAKSPIDAKGNVQTQVGSRVEGFTVQFPRPEQMPPGSPVLGTQGSDFVTIICWIVREGWRNTKESTSLFFYFRFFTNRTKTKKTSMKRIVENMYNTTKICNF